jgi:hypothetical protein
VVNLWWLDVLTWSLSAGVLTAQNMPPFSTLFLVWTVESWVGEPVADKSLFILHKDKPDVGAGQF